ncbi:helicase-exonuclease AddAB subunit AddB [Salimicrobium halophilum]|uniref:ATP-dependent helicase/deoxyribonuclease subunit B n=1 Tax=Salimicrobium halophilum TaxID=86666 RepID=A0A1G8TSP2_9BACI|nr:helicase-exonuclease AddAB subunit AddB [Salimicrobium halophilum]SDJ43935.1 DNA helicase/exodeoxyribonuclease V, subunit B [Salimicrobium halophilum]
MSVRFITGRSGAGKSEYCLGDIEAKLKEEPNGRTIVYLVPDQMTFQQEYALLKRGNIDGATRAQVFSFSRLAWKVFQETGGATRSYISSTGVQMLLRKIVEERTSDWNVFQKAMEKQGFIHQLEEMITEFKRYRVTPEDLSRQVESMESFVHRTPGELALQDKVEDLHYIYSRLTSYMEGSYVDGEDQLKLLTEKIPHSAFLDGAEIYIDGFHSFTPQEYEVIRELFQQASRVQVTLTLDEEKSEVEDVDLFRETKETCAVLKEMAKEGNVETEESLQLSNTEGRFQDKPAFLHMEKHFEERPAPAFEGKVPIGIYEAVHPRAEVEGAAQEILRLVREEGYRYREIAILMREPGVYHSLIDTIFSDYGIPVFLDEKRTMLNHPLLELVRSALDVIEGGWRYDAVFRLLKTGFIPSSDRVHPLDEDAIDELENYVLEYGIRSRQQWRSDEPWIYQRFRGFEKAAQTDEEKKKQERINAYRLQVTKALEVLDDELRGRKTNEQRAASLFEWMSNIRVPQTLEKWREYYDESGEVEKAREQEQAWDNVLQLLDEMVDMIGEETMSLQVFRQAFESGLDALTFAHVPPSLDHVVVGSVDRSRLSGMKAGFLLGVNEGTWPLKPPGDGMISEEDREVLAGYGIELAAGSREKLLYDRFYMYLAATMPGEKLWVSYPLSDEEGRTKAASPMIGRIEALFPACSEHILLQDPDDLEDASRFITTPVKTRSALTAQLGRYVKGYPMRDEWWGVLDWYIEREEKNSTTRRVLESLFYKNVPVPLKKETAHRMHKKQVKTSVSALESYYSCGFQHFAGKGLNLEERRTYKLDAPDIGQLFHEALRQITDWIGEDGRQFSQLDRNAATQYARRATQELAPVLQHQVLKSSNRYQYIQNKLENVIAQATYILGEQARRTKFAPVGLELGFGQVKDAELPPMSVDLPNGFELMLRGRIDRVDQAMENNELFLRIIDYKSSAKGLNLSDVYYGLSLQMLIYLEVILQNAKDWLGMEATPAGVLYFHVHNPMITGKKLLNDDEIEQEIVKSFKMQGLLLEDESAVRMMDTETDKGHSPVIPAGLKAKGGFYSNSKVADREMFQALDTYIRKLMTRAGMDITEGTIPLNPYQKKQQTACQFCSFRSVCQFDPTLEENQYRKLTEMNDTKVWEKLKEKGEADG